MNLISPSSCNAMNNHEIIEVRRSWEMASKRKTLFAQLFCSRMQLKGNPCRALFDDDAATNARQTLRLVGIAVNGLNQPRILLPLLETVGRQNATRIIAARQGSAVIRALLRTLKTTLGPSFDSIARHAWIAGYREVVQAMTLGMAQAARGKPGNGGTLLGLQAGGRAESVLLCRATSNGRWKSDTIFAHAH
mgnify:FL=1